MNTINPTNPMDPAVVSKKEEVHSLPGVIHRDPAGARQDIAAWDQLHRGETLEIRKSHSYFYTFGRLLLATLFIAMACWKLVYFRETVASVLAAGYGSASTLVTLGLALELLGGGLIALGWRVRIAAGALIGYLALVTVCLNLDQGIALNRAAALGNLGLVGALLLLVGHGAGAASLERAISRRRAHVGKV